MDHITHPAETPVTRESGTLVWVGDRTSGETSDAYQYCEDSVSQIAYRRDVTDALERPAACVQHVLVTRSDQRQTFEDSLDQLEHAYPNAQLIEMMGSLCEGRQRPDAQPRIESQRFYWHQWNQYLPNVLGTGDSIAEADRPLPHRSVAIVAGNFYDADPLMDLATSAGAVSVWCRCPEVLGARNFSVVWWDDSVATPASESTWENRLTAIERYSRIRPRHVWLTTAPRVHQYQLARSAGIDVVFSKPHRTDALLSTIQHRHSDLRASERDMSLCDPHRTVVIRSNATIDARAAA